MVTVSKTMTGTDTAPPSILFPILSFQSRILTVHPSFHPHPMPRFKWAHGHAHGNSQCGCVWAIGMGLRVTHVISRYVLPTFSSNPSPGWNVDCGSRSGGGELESLDHADEKKTLRPCCSKLVQGPAAPAPPGSW